MNSTNAIQTGIDNLLENCLELDSGQSLSIIREPPDLDYYSPTLPDTIAERAAEAGIKVEIIVAPFNEAPKHSQTALPPLLKNLTRDFFWRALAIRFDSALFCIGATLPCAAHWMRRPLAPIFAAQITGFS